MNIGFVSEALPYLPSPGGFRLYGANVIRCLSRHHRIHLVSLVHPDDMRQLAWSHRYCTTVTAIPAAGATLPARAVNFLSTYGWGKPLHYRSQLNSTLRQQVADQQWDVLHVEGSFVAGLIDPSLGVPMVLSLHDAWPLRCAAMVRSSSKLKERLYYRALGFVEPRYARLVYPRFDRCAFVTSADLAALDGALTPGTGVVIPNGIDTDYYHPRVARKVDGLVTFHGHLSYAPNVDAALFFAREVFPLIHREEPDAKLRLVGASPAPEVKRLARVSGIEVHANLPDLRAAVSAGQVYVCPVRHGSGVKNKLLEAMAMGLPVVSHPSAASGLDCLPGRDLLLGDEPQTFAKQVLRVLQNPDLATDLGSAARRLMEARYGWASRAEAYAALYRELALARHPGVFQRLASAPHPSPSECHDAL